MAFEAASAAVPYIQHTLGGVDPNVALPPAGFPSGTILLDNTPVTGAVYILRRNTAGVASWINIAAGGAPPGGPAGGDLDGTYPNPNVVGLHISGGAGRILYGTGADTWSTLAEGAVGQVLQSNGAAAPSWVSGTAPTGPAGGDLGGTYPNPTVVDLSIPVAGAGRIIYSSGVDTWSTLPAVGAGEVLYSNGANTWTTLAAGTSGQVLQSNGAGAPSWLGAAQGSLLYGNAGGGLSVLAPGAPGEVLQTNGPGADPTWVSSGGGGAVSYDFTGGALDYTLDPNYAPVGMTSTARPSTAILGATATVPPFWVYGTDLTASLERTTQPSLRLGVNAANSESMLQVASGTEGATNLFLPLPDYFAATQRWRIDAQLAVNISGIGLALFVNDFVTGRFGLVQYTGPAAVPTTVCVYELFSAAPVSGGAISEGTNLDSVGGYTADLTAETVAGINVRDVRIERNGARLTISTGPAGGPLVARSDISNMYRRGMPQSWALVLTICQLRVAAGALPGYWHELRSLTYTPL